MSYTNKHEGQFRINDTLKKLVKERQKPICQYCLADSRYTAITEHKDKRCPVCGAYYTGPRRSEEYQVLLNAGYVSQED